MWVQVGEDPFTKLKAEKRERVREQQKRQLGNLKASAKSGGGPAPLPPTLRLAAGLPSHGKGKPVRHKDVKEDVRILPHAVVPLPRGMAPSCPTSCSSTMLAILTRLHVFEWLAEPVTALAGRSSRHYRRVSEGREMMGFTCAGQGGVAAGGRVDGVHGQI